ncbi:MAG: hypothetical protein A2X23_00835 [Chloroflexi bacterium GWC2_73_18]|nr:MAG: hypothetical protein A2X23_00835 [Chloroflexi bacterium GWC2_73_18]
MADRRPRYAVLGLGNRLQGDEALGAMVVERLRAEPPDAGPGSLELIDGGTVGLGLLPYVAGLDGLVVVDAIEAGRAPGTRIDLDGRRLVRHGTAMGVHDLGARELLGALLVTGALPRRVRVVGAQPASLALGTDLSAAVAAALPGVCRAIRRRVGAWAAADAARAGGRRAA